jgi:hypothetical protein
MRKAVDLGVFRGFSVGSSPVVISHLQYADDTLCIGEASVDNLWVLKAILRGFEMASGLKVNFWKSGLVGLNVSPTFCKRLVPFLIVGKALYLLIILAFQLERIQEKSPLGILFWSIFGVGCFRGVINILVLVVELF